MQINHYLNHLEVVGKKHILLIVTPKNQYPSSLLDDNFYRLEQSVLENPKAYISIYEEGQEEMMQYVAFRLLVSPVICDHYSYTDRVVSKVKRLDNKGIVSFFALHHYYETVPYGEQNEDDAIKTGQARAAEFIQSHPLHDYEYGCVTLQKDSSEANVMLNLNFKDEHSSYYFGRVYAK